MAKLFDRVKVNIATTGTGTVTFGAASSNAFLTPTEAGCADTDTVRYVIVDGTDFEEGIGTIASSVSTMERTTVTKSKIGGTAGTSKINLSGTAVLALTASAADILVPVNNLSDLDDADTALDNLGGTTVGKALFTATDAAAARTATGVDKLVPKGHIYGLTLSNNVTDTTNDIDIAVGETSDADGNLMVLSSGITKRLDATWTVGTGNGGLDTGSIANTTYHVWLIQRSDTGVVDALFSTSATSPTMPANYDRKRRIGAIIRASGAILAFRQYGDVFKLVTASTNHNSTVAYADAVLSITCPIGLNLRPIFVGGLQQNATGDALMQVGDGDASNASHTIARSKIGGEWTISEVSSVITNVSAQIRLRVDISSGTLLVGYLQTLGWIDDRGRQ